VSEWRSNRVDLREPSLVVAHRIDVRRASDNVVTRNAADTPPHARAAGFLRAAATFDAERFDGAALPVWPVSRVTFAAF
jgi:hypothetical protein